MTAVTRRSDGGPGSDDLGEDHLPGPARQQRPEAAAAPPSPAYKHTRWQNFVRDMFALFGPAQTGLPPYATPEEREEWRLANLPEPPEARRASTAPPGYRMVEYRDSQGYRHRSLVLTTPARSAREHIDPPQPAGQAGDAEPH